MTALTQALLVAGGVGLRLRPLTDVLPKCLLPIGGRPLLGIWLDQLVSSGFQRIVVNTHHHAELVTDYVRSCGYDDRVILAHEPTLLGTAGTLLKHAPSFGAQSIFFAHADNLSIFKVEAFAQRHACRRGDVVMTMMTFETDAPRQCGIVEQDVDGLVVAFHEKQADPPGNLANAAIYIVDPAVAETAARLGREIVDFSTDVIPLLLGRVQTFHNPIYHRDIGTPESLALAQFDYPMALAAAGKPLGPIGVVPELFASRPALTHVFLKALAEAYAPSDQRLRVRDERNE